MEKTHNFNELINIELTKDQWQKISLELWSLLDDIDTGLDMYKPEMNNFTKYVSYKVGQRFEWLTSDRYRVFPTTGNFDKPCINL